VQAQALSHQVCKKQANINAKTGAVHAIIGLNRPVFMRRYAMEAAENFEILWRKELLKRLQSPLNTLTRQFEKENEKRLRRVEELRQYSSTEEAHDAYGYGYITLAEYEQICQDFENAENTITPVAAARDELKSFISRIESEIRYFKWENLSDEEKSEIEKRNNEWRKSMKNLQ
jgi:hypothetical protein